MEARDVGLLLELRHEIGGAHDRAGDELREERLEQREIDEVARRRDDAVIDVEDIGDALEREERDADRQDHLEDRDLALEPGRAQHVVQRRDEELEILEEAEHDEHDGDADPGGPFPRPLGFVAAPIQSPTR